MNFISIGLIILASLSALFLIYKGIKNLINMTKEEKSLYLKSRKTDKP